MEVKLCWDEEETYRNPHMEEEMEKFNHEAPCPEVEEEEGEETVESKENREEELKREIEEWEKEVAEWVKMLEDMRPEDLEAELKKEQEEWDSFYVVKDSSGKEIFVEADLPGSNLKKNSLGNILGETPSYCLHSIYQKSTLIKLTTNFD